MPATNNKKKTFCDFLLICSVLVIRLFCPLIIQFVLFYLIRFISHSFNCKHLSLCLKTCFRPCNCVIATTAATYIQQIHKNSTHLRCRHWHVARLSLLILFLFLVYCQASSHEFGCCCCTLYLFFCCLIYKNNI